MNNTKWREIFEILAEQDVKACTWYFLNDDGAYPWLLPLKSEIKETGIADGNWCPTLYKKIKKVRIPQIYEHYRGPSFAPQTRKNNLEILQQRLMSLGQLDMDVLQDEIIIYGYRS